jgi:hypothetical protein
LTAPDPSCNPTVLTVSHGVLLDALQPQVEPVASVKDTLVAEEPAD